MAVATGMRNVLHTFDAIVCRLDSMIAFNEKSSEKLQKQHQQHQPTESGRESRPAFATRDRNNRAE